MQGNYYRLHRDLFQDFSRYVSRFLFIWTPDKILSNGGIRELRQSNNLKNCLNSINNTNNTIVIQNNIPC